MTALEKRTRADARLMRAARRGDVAARAELAAKYDPFAWRLARRYYVPGAALDDLVQEARLGLLKAIDVWEPRRGAFMTCAAVWVRCYVMRLLHRDVHTNGARTVVNRGARVAAQLFQELRRDPTDEEVAARLKLKKASYVADARFATERRAELSPSLVDPVERADDRAERESEEADRARRVREALDALDVRERIVLRRRYLVEEGQEQTLAEIGELFDLSRERIRQIEAQALDKLAESLAVYAWA